jgi:hypothetical protein
MTKSKAEWVVAGGRVDEHGHCKRCGSGLRLEMPQHIEVVSAAMKAFVKVHSQCTDKGPVEPVAKTPADWARGRDTGISSGTIYAVMTRSRGPYGRYDIPHDPSDFGRCYRLLKLFPDWRPKLEEVSDRYPDWLPFVREWDKLTEMWEAALESKDGKEMYGFMAELRKGSL